MLRTIKTWKYNPETIKTDIQRNYLLCQYPNCWNDQSIVGAAIRQSHVCSDYSTNAKLWHKQWWLSNRLNLLINNEELRFQHASCSLPLIATLKALYKSVMRGREKTST